MRAFFIFLLISNTAFATKEYALTIHEQTLIQKYKSYSPTSVPLLAKPSLQLKSKTFSVPKFLETNIRFWLITYSSLSYKQVLIHDKENLDLVYRVYDFSELHQKKDLSVFDKVRLQNYHAGLKLNLIKKSLVKISKNQKLNSQDKKIKKIVTDFFKKDLKKKDYYNLSENLRTQTGQLEQTKDTFERFIVFEDTLYSYAKKFNLPKEVLLLSILESHFKTNAKSLVKAEGAWQIMPFISRTMFPDQKNNRHAKNLLVSSLGAFHILKHSHSRLKRWDLAITSYNAGFKNIRNALKQNKSLEKILGSDSNAIGFAVNNFYSQFIALVYLRENLTTLYRDLKVLPKKELNLYLTNCPTPTAKFLSMNNNIDGALKFLKRGSIIASEQKLSKKKFTLIPDNILVRYYPKDFTRKVKIGRCLEN